MATNNAMRFGVTRARIASTLSDNSLQTVEHDHLSRCNHSAPISMDLVQALQRLRNLADIPLHISSAFRCITHNRTVGSKDTSQHVLGLAADVRTPGGLTIEEFYAIADGMGIFRGIGRYEWGLHLDIRTGIETRW